MEGVAKGIRMQALLESQHYSDNRQVSTPLKQYSTGLLDIAAQGQCLKLVECNFGFQKTSLNGFTLPDLSHHPNSEHPLSSCYTSQPAPLSSTPSSILSYTVCPARRGHHSTPSTTLQRQPPCSHSNKKQPNQGKTHFASRVRVRVRVTQLYPPARAVEL